MSVETALGKFKEKYPDIYAAVYQQGVKAGIETSEAAQRLASEHEASQNVPAEESLQIQAKADWDADSDLRSEFRGNFETYLAYVKGDAAGRIRIVGRRSK